MPAAWNSVPSDIRQPKTAQAFKKVYKAHWRNIVAISLCENGRERQTMRTHDKLHSLKCPARPWGVIQQVSKYLSGLHSFISKICRGGYTELVNFQLISSRVRIIYIIFFVAHLVACSINRDTCSATSRLSWENKQNNKEGTVPVWYFIIYSILINAKIFNVDRYRTLAIR